jgi:hypothetical protein
MGCFKRRFQLIRTQLGRFSGGCGYSQIVSSLANIRSVYADNEKISTALKTYTFRLVSTTTEKVGWDFETSLPDSFGLCLSTQPAAQAINGKLHSTARKCLVIG